MGALFISYIFGLSFASRTKNHATYMIEMNYLLVNKK
jgi:hypothetical protein